VAAYTTAHWANARVVAKGLMLVFDLEPVSDNECDVMTFETLGGALAEMETQIDVLLPDEEETYTLKARWVTPREWELEQARWENVR
jgi:hypothetical protein